MTTTHELRPDEAHLMPRPAYVILAAWAPDRPDGPLGRPTIKHVHEAQVADYDIEWQIPSTYVGEAVDADGEVARTLRWLAEETVGCDWYVEIASDGITTFSGPGWQALDDLRHRIARDERSVVNP